LSPDPAHAGGAPPSALQPALPSAPADFIPAFLPLAPLAARPDIRLHMATAASRLSHLLGEGAAPPYWAFCWGGGLALVEHLSRDPDCVRGRRVLDFGAGSGVVAIAAALAGASHVRACEIDPVGRVAISLNSAANGVAVDVIPPDRAADAVSDIDLMLAGDTFYDATVAAAATAFFARCVERSVSVLVGDPGRAHLPHGRLSEIARYPVRDFAASPSAAAGEGVVYAFGRLEDGGNPHHVAV